MRKAAAQRAEKTPARAGAKAVARGATVAHAAPTQAVHSAGWTLFAFGADGGQAASGPGAARVAGDSVGRALHGPGRPMPRPLRQHMEQHFGAPLGATRLHTDERAAQAARVLHARAFALGPHVVFGAGEFAPHTPQGRHLLAHELAHVVQQQGSPGGGVAQATRVARAGAGPGLPISQPGDASEREAEQAAQAFSAGQPWRGSFSTPAQPQVHRWRWPWEDVPTGDQLVPAAVGGDTDAIVEIEDFSAVSEADRITMLGHLTRQIWVGGSSAAAMERIWLSFGDAFERVASDNLRLWRNCCARHTSLRDNIPLSAWLAEAFPADVLEVARDNLHVNRAYAEEVAAQFGLALDSDAAPAPLSDEQAGRLARFQVAAEGLAKLQFAQQAARTIPVGFVRVLEPMDAYCYERVPFDPEREPRQTQLPEMELGDRRMVRGADGESWVDPDHFGGGGDESSVEDWLAARAQLRELVTVQPYAPIKAQYDQSKAAEAALLAAFPALYAVATGGATASSAFAGAATPEDARTLLGQALTRLVTRIDDTELNLDSGELDALDLTPIHERLFASEQTVASGVDWSQALPQATGQDLARGHHLDLLLRRLLLQQVGQIAFLLAPLAGPAAIPLLLAGTAAAGTNFALDVTRYQALAAAAGSAAMPGTELVARSAVDEARMTAEAEGIAFALALLALGSTAAAAGLARIRAGAITRAAAQRTRLIEGTGAPSTVRPGGPLEPRPRELPYTAPPDLRTVRPGSPLDLSSMDPSRRYLWVVDAEGNVLVAAERQAAGVFSQGRTMAKHGDLVPGPGGLSRGAARAGGELIAETDAAGRPTGRWIMNNDSSYTFARTDATHSSGGNLGAAHELLGTTGTDTSRIVPINTSGVDRVIPP
jgi:hypothetical protein